VEYACGRVGGYTCSDLFLKRALPGAWCSRLDDPWGDVAVMRARTACFDERSLDFWIVGGQAPITDLEL
jgi:hypothetical protein